MLSAAVLCKTTAEELIRSLIHVTEPADFQTKRDHAQKQEVWLPLGG